MQNPVDFAVMEIHNEIPRQLLEMAKNTYNRIHNENLTLATYITKVIIHDRVLKLCNVAAGQIKTIPLRAEWIEERHSDHAGYAGDDGAYSLYRIPPEARDNMPITNILTIQYPYNTYIGGGNADLQVGTGGYCLIDQVDEVLNSYTLASPRNHPIGVLMSGDLIKIMPTQYAIQNWLLTCRIAYNDWFTNLHNSAIPVLAKLIVAATKQRIYTDLVVDIDRAVQETGADIGVIRQIVDSYADAGQRVDELVVKWRGVTLIDPESRKILMNMMF